jgi:dihydrofolate synthase/folylpolyglutamate synthase
MRLHPKLIDLSLDRMWRILARLGHPERRLPPVVHVAGTNGKGSVVAMLRAMLEAAGYRTQAYTSPHLVRFAERVRLADGPIDEAALTAILEECEAANGPTPITYFEITTAAALLAFSRSRADILLLEVGLGGRLDATNVIERPLLTAITPVALDHQQYLGPDLSSIAAEKAAIMKPGVMAVIGPQASAAARVIAGHSRRVGAPLMRYARRGPWPGRWTTRAVGERMAVRVEDRLFDLPPPALAGGHQVDNAGLAIACLTRLDGFNVDDGAMAAGLRRTEWPARLQRLDGGSLRALLPADAELWLDGGHNSAAGAALARWCARARAARPLALVVGMLETKDDRAFFAPFAPLAEVVYAVPIPGEAAARAAAATASGARAAGIPAHAARSVTAALSRIAQTLRRPRVLICGSLYLAGQVLADEAMLR